VNKNAMHKHYPKTSTDRMFAGPVRLSENRAAHGNIVRIDVCSCGAKRRTNINQQHRERGTWAQP
jgi:hypothetical protein